MPPRLNPAGHPKIPHFFKAPAQFDAGKNQAAGRDPGKEDCPSTAFPAFPLIVSDCPLSCRLAAE
jgi:hypothetical protein